MVELDQVILAVFVISISIGWWIDPNTKTFLNKSMHPVFGFPTFIRFSWSTIPKLIKEKEGVEIVWYAIIFS